MLGSALGFRKVTDNTSHGCCLQGAHEQPRRQILRTDVCNTRRSEVTGLVREGRGGNWQGLATTKPETAMPVFAKGLLSKAGLLLHVNSKLLKTLSGHSRHPRGPPEPNSSVPVPSLLPQHCHRMKKPVGVGEGVRKVDISDCPSPTL